MATPGEDEIAKKEREEKERTERRALIASVYVSALLAVAFQEAVDAVKGVVQESGFHWYSLAVFVVFFLTATRFLIGNLKHLHRERELPEWLWLVDFVVISVESIVLIFMGGVASVPFPRRSTFYDLILALFVIDLGWMLGQWILGEINAGWAHKRPHLAWAWLNAGLLVTIGILWLIRTDLYDVPTLAVFLALAVAGFVLDIFLFDRESKS
jgi:cation transport ATPase